MNPYLLLILVLLIGAFAIDVLGELLNTRNVKYELPPEFQNYYDPESYRKSLRYMEEKSRFGVFQSTLVLAVTIGFILLGGFNGVDELARAAGRGPIVNGLIFFGILFLARLALSLPFAIYHTFVIEERYGFNRTSPKTFVLDLLKGLVLGTILGAPILVLILWFFQETGDRAWLYSWIFFTVFQLALAFLAPVLIMPLFNRFDPVPDGGLKEAIEGFARRVDFRLSGIFTMDSSRRSAKTNAFFTGFGRFRRLVLFDTLIRKHSEEELLAIVAHEIGHFKRKHIIKSILLSTALAGGFFYGVSYFLGNRELFAAFRMNELSVYAALAFIALISGPILNLGGILTNMISRKFEFEADDYSLHFYGKPEVLISALKKLSVDNLSYLTPHWLKVLLDYSHPPILERIRHIQARS